MVWKDPYECGGTELMEGGRSDGVCFSIRSFGLPENLAGFKSTSPVKDQRRHLIMFAPTGSRLVHCLLLLLNSVFTKILFAERFQAFCPRANEIPELKHVVLGIVPLMI